MPVVPLRAGVDAMLGAASAWLAPAGASPVGAGIDDRNDGSTMNLP